MGRGHEQVHLAVSMEEWPAEIPSTVSGEGEEWLWNIAEEGGTQEPASVASKPGLMETSPLYWNWGSSRVSYSWRDPVLNPFTPCSFDSILFGNCCFKAVTFFFKHSFTENVSMWNGRRPPGPLLWPLLNILACIQCSEGSSAGHVSEASQMWEF